MRTSIFILINTPIIKINLIIYIRIKLCVFGENIFYVNDKLSITPGFRFENIITRSDGSYKQINLDGAGNVIYNNEVFEKRKNIRRFVLLGIGISYKLNSEIEFYGNVSQVIDQLHLQI